jgi:hypothetical protein
VSNYINISNMGVFNWIYGNISSSDYYIRLFNTVTSNNVTICPESAPFVLVNTTYCSQCTNSTPIYDANLRVCVAGCAAGTFLDTNLRLCVPTSNNTFNCISPGQYFNLMTQSCECATSTPYFTGSNCITCLAPNYWNATTKTCNECNLNNQ